MTRDEALRALVGTMRRRAAKHVEVAVACRSAEAMDRHYGMATATTQDADELDAVLAATPDEGQRPTVKIVEGKPGPFNDAEWEP